MTTEEYRALFNPRGQHVEGVLELADEESRVEAQEDVPEDEKKQDPPPPQSAQLANARMGGLLSCGFQNQIPRLSSMRIWC